jgi:integrase
MPQSHVVKRGSQFYFRIAVPLPLTKLVGKRELKASLRTSDVMSAKTRGRVLSNGLELLFRELGTKRLSGEAVCLVVRERVRAAGIDPASYSGHSLRAGLVTSAAHAGVPTWKIRQQTGHASDAMLSRYIRDKELFLANAAGALL